MTKTRYLRRIENGIIIPAVSTPRSFKDGKRLLGTRPAYLESMCEGAIVASTQPIVVSIYETTMPTFWTAALRSLEVDPNELFFRNPNHILAFYESLSDHFRKDGWATFFPFAVVTQEYVIGHWHLKIEGRCTSFRPLGHTEGFGEPYPVGEVNPVNYVVPEV